MQPYQEEYLANARKIIQLKQGLDPQVHCFADFARALQSRYAGLSVLITRNMQLLRDHLLALLDDLPQADDETLQELEQFASQLLNNQEELDAGLFCHIRQALLTLARQRHSRSDIIRQLYWLGIGRNSRCSKMVGLEYADVEKYMTQMRLCFTEAAAYLKYYDEIEDSETRGYILRSRANMALGQFKQPHEKIQLVRGTLQVLQDKDYQRKAPDLPWERYIYMTHQHMATSISYSREKVMSAEDMASIMESSYIVYQKRIQEAEALQQQPSVRWAFPYYAIEYYCGLSDLDRLLTKTEDLIDATDDSDYSRDGMYGQVSLPAFYLQYLKQYPDRLPGRQAYVCELYARILRYVKKMPGGDETLFLYLWQLAQTFIEVEGGPSYGDFLQTLMLRFTPEVYLHSRIVGEAARALCEVLLEEEPRYFDDIDFIRALPDAKKKRETVLDYAVKCGIFHDVGKLNFIGLYTRCTRLWFEEEYELVRLHPMSGHSLLGGRPSTRRYAAVALGHHTWYDGSRSYPGEYVRLACPSRQMVDVIALVDWLETVTHTARLHTGTEKAFNEAVEAAIAKEGKQFSPLLTTRLRAPAVQQHLADAFSAGRKAACQSIYDEIYGQKDEA